MSVLNIWQQKLFRPGGMADIFKQTLLMRCAANMNSKPQPWTYVDYYGGVGPQRVDPEAAPFFHLAQYARYNYRRRRFQPLQDYMQRINLENMPSDAKPREGIPGWIWEESALPPSVPSNLGLMKQFLRHHDRAIVLEQNNMKRLSETTIKGDHRISAIQAVPTVELVQHLVPPLTPRGLVMFDACQGLALNPAHRKDVETQLNLMGELVYESIKRWPTATHVITYPIGALSENLEPQQKQLELAVERAMKYRMRFDAMKDLMEDTIGEEDMKKDDEDTDEEPITGESDWLHTVEDHWLKDRDHWDWADSKYPDNDDIIRMPKDVFNPTLQRPVSFLRYILKSGNKQILAAEIFGAHDPEAKDAPRVGGMGVAIVNPPPGMYHDLKSQLPDMALAINGMMKIDQLPQLSTSKDDLNTEKLARKLSAEHAERVQEALSVGEVPPKMPNGTRDAINELRASERRRMFYGPLEGLKGEVLADEFDHFDYQALSNVYWLGPNPCPEEEDPWYSMRFQPSLDGVNEDADDEDKLYFERQRRHRALELKVVEANMKDAEKLGLRKEYGTAKVTDLLQEVDKSLSQLGDLKELMLMDAKQLTSAKDWKRHVNQQLADQATAPLPDDKSDLVPPSLFRSWPMGRNPDDLELPVLNEKQSSEQQRRYQSESE